MSCPESRPHSRCHSSCVPCLASRIEAAVGGVGGKPGPRGAAGRAGGRTFRGAVFWVALAVPAGEVRQDPLTLLRLPHQREGLQEGSGGQFKDAGDL